LGNQDRKGEYLMNRTALVISALLTAFLLAIVGGVVYTVRGVQTANAAKLANASTPTAPASTEPAPSLDPQTQQEIQQREATYQNLIAQANERLLQAQQKQQELQAQLAILQTTTDNSAQAPAPVQVPPEQAAQIAAQYLNQTSIYSVETTFIKGVMVYKVTMSSGDIAYGGLDGQFIGVQPPPAVQPNERDRGHNDSGGGDDDEHESEDHDD
jgi:hypothetical protein